MSAGKIRSFKKSSIRDVAAAAGVSVTTISYFVGGRETVCSPETAARIRKAIRDLHYTPSTPARGMRERATRTLGVVVDDPVKVFNAPHETYARRLWTGILDESDAIDYGVLCYPLAARHRDQHNRLLDGRVDGLLIKAGLDDPRPALTAEAGLPTVVFDHYKEIPAGCGAACSEESAVVNLALSHLWDLGHRRIAHLAGPTTVAEGEDRASVDCGWSEIATARCRLTSSWLTDRSVFVRDFIASSDTWHISVADATRILSGWMACDDPPTAVFCADDAMAISMLQAARNLEIDVPGDLSIVGIDNGIEARECAPALTTVDIPVEEIGRQGVRALVRRMRGEPCETCRCWIPPTGLVHRASSGPRRV